MSDTPRDPQAPEPGDRRPKPEGEASTSPDEGDAAAPAEPTVDDGKTPGRDPVRRATLVVLGLCVLFFLTYIRADRVIPFSQQARIRGYTVPVVPMVSGYVTDISVDLHEEVAAGDVLVRIDTAQYQIGVRSARATLDNTRQQLDVASQAVLSAAAQVAAARAQEGIARREVERLTLIVQRSPGAISESDVDRSEAALTGAEAQVEAAQSELQRARTARGVIGDDNPAIRAAMAGLENAELNLTRTVVRAPSRGAIESLELDVGHFAAAGQALMTFVSTADVWIRADMRENQLEFVQPGQLVRIILESSPGDVFEGTIRSVGLGVGTGRPSSRGALPQVNTSSGWLRQPQQFPVIIELGPEIEPELLRLGGQATVMVFTGRHLLNPVGRVVMRFLSLLSYVR